MTHVARMPALWPSMDVVHSASMLGTKEGQNYVHSVYSLSLLEKKEKKKKNLRKRLAPGNRGTLPAQDIVTGYSSAH